MDWTKSELSWGREKRGNLTRRERQCFVEYLGEIKNARVARVFFQKYLLNWPALLRASKLCSGIWHHLRREVQPDFLREEHSLEVSEALFGTGRFVPLKLRQEDARGIVSRSAPGNFSHSLPVALFCDDSQVRLHICPLFLQRVESARSEKVKVVFRGNKSKYIPVCKNFEEEKQGQATKATKCDKTLLGSPHALHPSFFSLEM